MHRALEEAARSGSPAVAQSLVGAVQDIAELAGGLPPSMRSRELQAGATFANIGPRHHDLMKALN